MPIRWIDSDRTFRIRLSFHRHALTRALIIRVHANDSLSRSCGSRFQDGGAHGSSRVRVLREISSGRRIGKIARNRNSSSSGDGATRSVRVGESQRRLVAACFFVSRISLVIDSDHCPSSSFNASLGITVVSANCRCSSEITWTSAPIAGLAGDRLTGWRAGSTRARVGTRNL